MKDCRRARERMGRALDGRLGVEELFELEEHARVCPRCRRELERSQALEEALQSLPTPPLKRLDAERALERIHARIAENERSVAPSARSRRVLFAGAAALLLAALVPWIWLRFATRSVAPVIATSSEPTTSQADSSLAMDGIAATTDARADATSVDLAESAPIDPLAWMTDYDGTRHAWARSEVARILVACATEVGEVALFEPGERSEHLATFLEAFDRQARPLADAGWPLLRLVQGLIAGEDVLVARAAARYVGARGDRGALRELALVLSHEEKKRAAALALAGAGPAGLEELQAAFWDPSLAPIVVAGLDGVADDVALRWIEDLLRDARRDAESHGRRTLAALLLSRIATMGSPAARVLLSLADHPLLDRTAVLDAFAQTEAASELLVDAVKATRSGADGAEDELLLAAIARLAPPECFEWVLRRARSAKNPAAALHALACYPGTQASFALLELRSTSSRADEAAQLEAWRTALDFDPGRFVELAADPWLITDPAQLRRLLESLVLCEHPSAVPALLALARRPALADDDREGAVLTAGELGSVQDLPSLAELLAELGGRETRLAAALVWSAFALAGEQGVRVLLGESEPSLLARLLERLSSPHARSRPTSTLFQLARALEPWLDRRDPIAKETR